MVTVVTYDNIHLNGIERKGTVKVRPSWKLFESDKIIAVQIQLYQN